MSIKAYTVAAVVAAGLLGLAGPAGAQMRPTGIVPTPTYYNAQPTYYNSQATYYGNTRPTFYNAQPTYYNSQATYYSTGWNYAPSVPVGAVPTGTSLYTTPYSTYSPLGATSTPITSPITSSTPFQLLTPQQPVQLPSMQLPLTGQPVQLPSTQGNLSSSTNLPSVAASGVMTGTPAWSTLPYTGTAANEFGGTGSFGTYSRSPYTGSVSSGSYGTGPYMPLSSGMYNNSPLYTNPTRVTPTTGNLGYTPLWSTGYYSQYGWPR
jgi:hypothetical protein